MSDPVGSAVSFLKRFINPEEARATKRSQEKYAVAKPASFQDMMMRLSQGVPLTNDERRRLDNVQASETRTRRTAPAALVSMKLDEKTNDAAERELALDRLRAQLTPAQRAAIENAGYLKQVANSQQRFVAQPPPTAQYAANPIDMRNGILARLDRGEPVSAQERQILIADRTGGPMPAPAVPMALPGYLNRR